MFKNFGGWFKGSRESEAADHILDMIKKAYPEYSTERFFIKHSREFFRSSDFISFFFYYTKNIVVRVVLDTRKGKVKSLYHVEIYFGNLNDPEKVIHLDSDFLAQSLWWENALPNPMPPIFDQIYNKGA